MAKRLQSASAQKPLIGVTGPASRRGLSAWWFTRYALRQAGAQALRITPALPAIKAPLDGLIIGGGDDIDPRRYGSATALTARIDPERDELEWRMLDYASERSIPLLGICRGAQLINVYHGGTLHQDLTSVIENLVLRRTALPLKTISIEAGTRLETIMQATETRVNSLHRQGVDRLAGGFRIAARDCDNIVQAIEPLDQRWLLGVQWHPEYLPQRRAHRRIFRALVTAARQRAAGK